jgi:UDP-N-acetylmuramate: L-alanyl-gamma-D-glutamyl-meso-diaminopimelate ligase
LCIAEISSIILLFFSINKGPIHMNNTIPADVRHIHLTAICGTAMGALAGMLKEMGYQVSGSDQQVYPPMSDFLQSKGIVIFNGYHVQNLTPRPDLVVVGNAVTRDNPEVVAMQAMGLPYCSMPEAINRFAAAGKRQIIVTGTHGKTTTSSFIAWMLHVAGRDPSFLIGGIVNGFESNFRAGRGEWIVLEGDEYDTAFFDKGPKFLHYTPDITILTSVEFDHADIYTDLNHVKSAFTRLIGRLADTSLLVAFDDDANVSELAAAGRCGVIRYGCRPESAWRLDDIRIRPPYTHFSACRAGERAMALKTRMIGEHNLHNLLAGIAAGTHIGLDPAQIAQALESFPGVRRRQQVRGVKRDVIVIDDFAHHPTAVRETVRAVKSFYSPRRVIAVFEPRTNSSRRDVFQNDYATVFESADLTCVRQAPHLEKIPPQQRFSSERLVADLQKRGQRAHFFAHTDGILDFLVAEARADDVILIMSNGGFDNIHTRLLERL